MKKILIIEDDADKSKKIQLFLKDNYQCDITEKKSYKSGLKELIKNGENYDFILMDMSMPNFDITEEEPDGGSHEGFAGRDLLEQMKLREIDSKVFIVTQLDAFGESVNKLSLEELKEQMKEEFCPIYRDTIYYNTAQENWKTELKEKIGTLND